MLLHIQKNESLSFIVNTAKLLSIRPINPDVKDEEDMKKNGGENQRALVILQEDKVTDFVFFKDEKECKKGYNGLIFKIKSLNTNSGKVMEEILIDDFLK
jgi:hypothetical protein